MHIINIAERNRNVGDDPKGAKANEADLTKIQKSLSCTVRHDRIVVTLRSSFIPFDSAYLFLDFYTAKRNCSRRN